MTFAKLVEILSKEYSIDILSQEEDSEIQNIALIDDKRDNTIKNTLYFGYDKQLKSLISVPPQCIIARTNCTLPSLCNLGTSAVVRGES